MKWRRICAVDDLARGSLTPMAVDGVDVLVIRGDQAVTVVPPSCPHMLAPLSEGLFDGCVLTCTKPLWQWTVDDGQPQGLGEEPLLRYPTREENGDLYVDIENELRYDHQCEADA